MTAILQEIVSLLTSGITQFATGLGTGIQNLVSSIFLDGSGESQTLSTFGGVIIIFAAIALSIGLSRWVTSWVSSLGN